MAGLHLVANRLPVEFDERAGWARAPGGLVTALDAVVRRRAVSWWGSGATLPAPADHLGSLPALPSAIKVVDVDPGIAAAAVDGFASSTLWPALHGETGRVRQQDEWLRAYRRYNAAFANRLAARCAAGDLVWVHDYHLLLLPGLLRRDRPDLSIGLSLHTPVDAAALGRLSAVGEIVAGLVAADLVGVQTERDRAELDRLIRAHDVIADRNGSQPATFVSPVSVDVENLRRWSSDPAFEAMRVRHLRRAQGRRVVVGVDRLDYTKGLIERLQGVELAFRRGVLRPDGVQVVQIAQPTRAAIGEYADLRVQVERLAHELAARWIRADGLPAVQVHVESWDRREVMALLSVADLALVTPRRDGMNLVAKEFTVVNDRDGVLVLGEGAGAVEALGRGSVVVDGADPESVVDGIERAVTLTTTQRAALAAHRRTAVTEWTSLDWADDFHARLAGVERARVSARRRRPPWPRQCA